MSLANTPAPSDARQPRRSLRTAGIAVLMAPLVVLSAVFVFIYRAEGEVQAADITAGRVFAARAELQKMAPLLHGARASLRGYTMTKEREFLGEFEQARASAERSLAQLRALIPDAGVAGLAPALDSARRELNILGEIAGREAGADPLPALWDSSQAAQQQADSLLASLLTAQEQALERARNMVEARRTQLRYTAALCALVGPLGALLLHFLVIGRLTRRIRALEDNARRLARGSALQDLPRSAEEIVAVGRALEDAAHLLGARDRELRESELRYRNLFDHAPLPFEETDREGRIRRVNQAACALLKLAPEQVLGLPAWHFLDPGVQEDFRRAMLGRIETATEISPYESTYLLADGSRITLEIRESLIRNEQAEVTGVCRSLLDVTERNLAEVAARKVAQYAMELRNKNEQLAQALEAARSAADAKGRFLASMSHELRTPLNAIIGFSEMMYDGKLGTISADHRECLQDILTSARHLLRLISDILDLSKIEAGRMEFCPEPCQIGALVAEVRDVIRPLADKKRIELLMDVPLDLEALIDASRFKQVLYNYLSNAVKFTPEGGWITIRGVAEKTQFRLEVEDTGIGIPEDEISKLFHEFQQLPNSRKAEQGTGLGLALTRRIVEAQGGSVAVRSTPGMGSVFSAVLPLQPVAQIAPLARVS